MRAAGLLGLLLPAIAAAQPAPAPLPELNPPPAPAPDVWEPRDEAVLRALDKISARETTLTLRVGQSLQYGSLTVSLQRCLVRPPDQRPDAAAFLHVTDSRSGGPGFAGWMLSGEPWIGVLQHPVYDLALSACR